MGQKLPDGEIIAGGRNGPLLGTFNQLAIGGIAAHCSHSHAASCDGRKRAVARRAWRTISPHLPASNRHRRLLVRALGYPFTDMRPVTVQHNSAMAGNEIRATPLKK